MCDYVKDAYTFTQTTTPEEFIELMYDKRTEDGVTFIPGPLDDSTYRGESFSYRCRINWNDNDRNEAQKKFASLFDSLKEIARHAERLDGTNENAKRVLDNDDLFYVWVTYIKDFCTDCFDMKKIHDIVDRIKTVNWIKDLSKMYAENGNLDNIEKEFMRDYIDVTVTDAERKYYKEYVNSIYAESESRVGKNICAYKLIHNGWRVFKLLTLSAPDYIVNYEACQLAAMLVMHDYGASIEAVDNSTRKYFEQFDSDDDEFLDKLYRPLKQNKRKSMAPLFVYLVLKEHSSSARHLRQNEILKYLENMPYEITIERKALSRTIHNLADSQLGVYTDVKTGTWIEQ